MESWERRCTYQQRITHWITFWLMGVATLGVHYLFGALYVVLLEDLAEPFPVC